MKTIGCTAAAGVVLETDSLIILAQPDTPVHILKYDSTFDNYYYYQSFPMDYPVFSVSVFYTGGMLYLYIENQWRSQQINLGSKTQNMKFQIFCCTSYFKCKKFFILLPKCFIGDNYPFGPLLLATPLVKTTSKVSYNFIHFFSLNLQVIRKNTSSFEFIHKILSSNTKFRLAIRNTTQNFVFQCLNPQIFV